MMAIVLGILMIMLTGTVCFVWVYAMIKSLKD